MLSWIVEFAPAIKNAARFHHVPFELEAHAEQMVRRHEEGRIADSLRLGHQVVSTAAVLAKISLDGVKQRDCPENREQLRRIAELVAQLACAREDRLDLGT